MAESFIYKAKPRPDYPCEEGRYIRGNDYSPVAVDKYPEYTPTSLLVILLLDATPQVKPSYGNKPKAGDA
jgi:hypothetical protein